MNERVSFLVNVILQLNKYPQNPRAKKSAYFISTRRYMFASCIHIALGIKVNSLNFVLFIRRLFLNID